MEDITKYTLIIVFSFFIISMVFLSVYMQIPAPIPINNTTFNEESMTPIQYKVYECMQTFNDTICCANGDAQDCLRDKIITS